MNNKTECLPFPKLSRQDCEVAHCNYLILGIFSSIYASGAIILNAAFIFTVIFRKTLHTQPNYLLLALSVADFLNGLLTQMLYAVICIKTSKGFDVKSLDRFVSTAGYLFGQVSFMMVSVVTFERYFAIVHPFLYQRFFSGAVSVFCIAATWLLPIVVLVITGMKQRALSGVLVVQVIIGWLLSLFCYIKILGVIKKLGRRQHWQQAIQSDKQGQQSSHSDKQGQQSSHSDKQGKQSSHSDKQGKQSSHSEKQGKQSSHSDKQGKQSSHSDKQGKQSSHSDKQGKQSSHADKQGQQASQSAKHDSDVKGVRVVALVLFTLLFCYTPFIVGTLCTLIQNRPASLPSSTTDVNFFLMQWAIVVTMLTSGLNPLIYYFRMHEVRKEFWALIRVRRTNRVESKA